MNTMMNNYENEAIIIQIDYKLAQHHILTENIVH